MAVALRLYITCGTLVTRALHEMPQKTKTKWSNARVPEAMLAKVDEFLRTQRAKDLGLKSRADVMREALKDLLRKEGVL